MSVFSQEMEKRVKDVLRTPFNIRDGRVVPEDDSDSIVFRDGAVRLDATYAYADLAESSTLAQRLKQEAAAAIIRSYVNSVSRIFTHYGGAIRSFDGDRVMAIFVGDRKNEKAVRAALAISWATWKVIQPGIEQRWNDIAGKIYDIEQSVGIDTGTALIVRGGARANSDLISVGAAPNVAAKLSDERGSGSTLVTRAVYNDLPDSIIYATQSGNKVNRFTSKGQLHVGGKSFDVLGSTWWWEP